MSQPGKRLYFDTEGNDLLPGLHSMWCLGIIDLDTLEEFYYGPPVPRDAKHPVTGEDLWTPILGNPAGTVEDGIRALEQAELSVAHNGIDYDYIAIEKLYPWFQRCPKAWDSLVAAKVVWPYDTLLGPDLKRVKAGIMPMSMAKRHSLKAWGYRLGDYKDEYTGGFEAWNPWMASYMMQDCRPGVKLWKMIEDRVGWAEGSKAALVWPELVFEVEHEVARIIKQQEMHGVHFDRAEAERLSAELANEQARTGALLVEAFGSWWAPGKATTPARDRTFKRDDLPSVTRRRFGKTGKELAPYVGPPVERYAPDAPYTPVVWTTFQPSSRDHLGQRLQAVYGWKPKKFGSNGKPTVDETTLEEIPEAVMPKATRQLILDYFVVSKTLGTLANGKKSWLGLCTPDTNRIHGRMDPSGAVTGRGTHKDPNLSGTPSVKKEKVVLADGTKTEVVVKGLKGRYGWECRALFIADEGWEQTGVDASSLELIDLGHYLLPLDEGAFSARVCDPSRDPHQEHADIADMTRADAKTAIYLFVYGGGAYKLSLDLSVEPHEELEYLGYKGLPMLLKNLAKRFDQDFVDKLDDNQKARIAKARTIILKFEKNIEGLRDLIDRVSETAARGWLKGLDGRRLHVRKAYSALNTLLQSAGAQTCKLWMMLVHRRLAEKGLKIGVDYKQTLWVHDELQFTHRPGLGPIISEVAKDCIKEAGEILGLRGQYRGDAKTGKNWAECH
ncbi:DNA polymerase [Aminobacter sp. HY435]|uniref:DNA polymerase n=1 Tax=Aminobacter sp. HY435 TaxID=2970917 RepID=UPI0022B95C68|nr:DNA polymerase [Aminobacter sp. HY435]